MLRRHTASVVLLVVIPKVVRVRRSALSGSDNEIDFTVSEVSSGALTSFVTEPVSTLLNSAYYFSPDSHSHVDFDSDITLADGETMSLKYFFDGVTGTDLLFDSGGASANSMLITTSISPRVRINSESIDFGVGCKLLINQLDTLTIARSGNDITITTGTGAVTKSFTSGAFTFNRLGGNSSQTFQGVFYNLQIGSRHNYTGLGGAATAWNDTVGSNNGTPDNLVSFTGQTVHGFVDTWFDQSGNGNDAEQATAGSQPKIVSAGSLVANGLDFDGSDDRLTIPNDLIASINSASSFLVAKSDTTSSSRIALALSHSTSNFRFYAGALLSSKFNFGYQDTALKIELGAADTNKHLFTSIAGSSNAEAFLDGTSKGTVSSVDGKSTLSSGGIGSINTGNFWSGTIEEVIVYNTDQSANRVALETNIQTAYPTLP